LADQEPLINFQIEAYNKQKQSKVSVVIDMTISFKLANELRNPSGEYYNYYAPIGKVFTQALDNNAGVFYSNLSLFQPLTHMSDVCVSAHSIVGKSTVIDVVPDTPYVSPDAGSPEKVDELCKVDTQFLSKIDICKEFRTSDIYFNSDYDKDLTPPSSQSSGLEEVTSDLENVD